MDYPESLHLAHNSFPLAAERLEINDDMLSPYAKDCHTILRGKEKYSATKLSATFNKRENYVAHYVNIQTYLRLGLKLKKVHRVLSFRQTNFLEPYIKYCTMKRATSKSKFQESLYKFFANAVFGKCIENVRSRIEIKFAKNSSICGRYISNPRYNNFKIINENLAAVFLQKATAELNRPIAVGFTILERSKEFMTKSFYDIFRPAYANKVSILMHDTDSFLMRVTSNTKCDNIQKIKHVLDFSKYDSNHRLYSLKNKNRLGYFKDEVKGNVITEVCALRSKVYSLQIEETHGNIRTENRAKGVRKGFSCKIPFSTFKNCVKTITDHRVSQYNILSRNHNVSTVKLNKLCFSSFCDKRSLAICGIHSYPYGSKLIRKYSCFFCVRDKIIVKRLT